MRALSTAIRDLLVDWRGVAWPVDWAECFGRRAPLTLEIGFGNGEFLAMEAREHPERDYVGIELSWSAVRRLFRRLERRRLDAAAAPPNVRVLMADAAVALRHLFAAESLDEVVANHPCPWPKARHLERRLFDREFLSLLATRMAPGARLTLVTDHQAYAEWLGDELAAQTALASCHATIEAPGIPGRRTTKYQRKAMAEGVAIHYFEWERSAAPDPVPAGALEARDRIHQGPTALAMPSVTLRGSFDREHLFQGFEPQLLRETHEGVDVVVRLLGTYRGDDGRTWLVETLVLEDGLRQEFASLVSARGPEELIVLLSGLGRPHPTHGVKRAVWLVGRWLRERHPGLTVAHENVGLAAASGSGGT